MAWGEARVAIVTPSLAEVLAAAERLDPRAISASTGSPGWRGTPFVDPIRWSLEWRGVEGGEPARSRGTLAPIA
jgi:hypothetical protein